MKVREFELMDVRARQFKKVGAASLVLALMVLVATIWSGVSNVRMAGRAAAETETTRSILQQVDALLSSLKDAETGQRGYLLTGDRRYLDPYVRAVAAIKKHLPDLERALFSIADQREPMVQLSVFVHQKLAELEKTIDVRDSAGPEAAGQIVLTDRGKEFMDGIRRTCSLISTAEYMRLEERERTAQRREDRAALIAGAGSALLFLLVLAGVVALIRGASARERLSGALEESREWLATTLTSIGDGVIATDRYGKVSFMNPVSEVLTGWSEAEAIGETLDRVFHIVNETTRERVEDPARKVLRLGTVVGLANHTTLIRKDGSEVPIDDSGAPIRDAEGAIIGVVLVFRDIRERRATEERQRESNEALLRTNEELQQFAYAASHDLQEPLRTITSYAQLLDRRFSEKLDEEGRQFIQFTVEGARRMKTLIDDLLNLTRAGASERKAPKPIDTTAVLQNTLTQLQTAIDESGAELRFDELPSVPADDAELSQVFQNLISNSIKYRRAGVPLRIEVKAEVRGGACEFEVCDNGQGFSREQAEIIFAPFKRLHGRDVPGTGIGLALCKRVIERYGGRIWAEGTPGQGARFFFTLPLAAAAAGQDREAARN